MPNENRGLEMRSMSRPASTTTQSPARLPSSPIATRQTGVAFFTLDYFPTICHPTQSADIKALEAPAKLAFERAAIPFLRFGAIPAKYMA